jgi:hypothetical protein
MHKQAMSDDGKKERTSMQAETTTPRNMFFRHFTRGLPLPLFVKRPFSMILTAGKSCRGVESRIATE